MLSIRGLTKKFGEKTVLRGVDLEVADGEIKGVIGVNGAGKSTLIECVCGVKKPDSGEISLFGMRTEKKSGKKMRARFGYMPQSFRLFNDLTAEENLKYLCAIYDLPVERSADVMRLCNLESAAKTLAGNLSGGYRRLLSMAGALIHSPSFLILDEPTAGMDPIFRRRFWEILRSYREEKKATVLVITHYLEELRQCDRFVCLSAGKAVFEGPIAACEKDVGIEEILMKYAYSGETT